ncbi:MAG TPA: amidohydrolase family protein [Abditibacteriaceae bacterium]|nr:amidohydrolase family protein [Abditibacteriaceae bacterium]
MPTEIIEAIDVHAHFGTYLNGRHPLINQFMTGDADVVVERARAAHTRLTIASPLRALMPRFGGDPVGGNAAAARVVEVTPGLLHWVVIDPLKPETYDQADEMLQLPKCVGIKIHPEEHGYPIAEHGAPIFRFAAARRAIILTHSGEQNSLPADFVPFADEFPEARLILAHLGCGWDGNPGHQVHAIQSGQHDNLFVDTSSAMSIMSGLIEWAVAEIGAERILYGTDTPLYSAAMQRARIDSAAISDAAKRLILCDNAMRLFELAQDEEI